MNNDLNPYSSIRKILLVTLAASLFVVISGCKPDYQTKRLRVDAITKNDGRTGWRMEITAPNMGTDGPYKDDNGIQQFSVPVMITAVINNSNLNGCPSQSSQSILVYSGPKQRTLMTWKHVPVKSGPIYSFPDTFILDSNPPKNCVPHKFVIDWDASKPDYESMINESNEVNNKIVIDITNWPQKKTWVLEQY